MYKVLSVVLLLAAIPACKELFPSMYRDLPVRYQVKATRSDVPEGPPSAPALMPLPGNIEHRDGRLRIDSNFKVVVEGRTDARLRAGVERFADRLSKQTGLPIKPDRSSDSPITLTVKADTPGLKIPALNENETYQLTVSPSGAQLHAQTTVGALRGLETFLQLVSVDAKSYYLPAVQIDDKPRFQWRGLMIDASRHWMPVDVIHRNLDAMAAVKLNVFHWHLSDDQGFRVESKIYPQLQQFGSDGKYYTQAQIREVVAYAAERGIRVVPEFDMPGHTTAWFVGMPELASAPGPYKVERFWGIFEPTMDPSREAVYAVIDELIGEMAGLFPDQYFHIGGDEVEDKQWKANPEIQKFAAEHNLKDAHALQAYFTHRVQAIVAKHSKIMIGWDEVLTPGLPESVVIQSWRGPEALAEAAQKGYRGILSYGYYLDHLRPASFHYGIDPMAQAGNLTAEQSSRILGGEACMWTEYANSESVDSRIWPRMAAIAERFWSPRATTDVDSMYARMTSVSRGLDYTGVKHHSAREQAVRRLSAGGFTGPVADLVNAVETQGVQGRRDARKYSSLVPLNRLVDAASPESELVRELTVSAQRYIANPAGSTSEKEELRTTFELWKESPARLAPAMARNYVLEEVASLSRDLSRVGAVGLEALGFIESDRPAPTEWIQEQRRFLKGVEQPKSEVVLCAVRPVRVLLETLSTGRAAHQSGKNGPNVMDSGSSK